jgi:hypothetical protein
MDWATRGMGDLTQTFKFTDLKRTGHLQDLDADGSIILKRMIKKLGVRELMHDMGQWGAVGGTGITLLVPGKVITAVTMKITFFFFASDSI